MFTVLILVIVFCLLGYIFGRGQAALFYDEQIELMQMALDSKRETIKKLRDRIEEDDEADWWKRGEEAPY